MLFRSQGVAVPARSLPKSSSSLAANLSQSPAPRISPAPAAFSVPRREDIPAANPFSSPPNPFGSPGPGEAEDNPFAEASSRPPVGSRAGPVVEEANNPFGDDGDYDEEKNPFAD